MCEIGFDKKYKLKAHKKKHKSETTREIPEQPMVAAAGNPVLNEGR